MTFDTPSFDMAQRLFHRNGLVQAAINLQRAELGLPLLGSKPTDHDFVRSVYQGGDRWHGDKPPSDVDLGWPRRP